MSPKDLSFFFRPGSVAVVGASDKKTGAELLANVMASQGVTAHPVNPNYRELAGLPCYPSVRDIPGPLDLAIVLVPAKGAPRVLADCLAKGVPGVMIESAGFTETGEEGRALQRECLDIAARGGMRLWGPNCMGLVDVAGKRFFTFMFGRITKALTRPGRISLVVQSGMLSAAFQAELATRRAVGVAKVASIGNKCDVDECDLLPWLLDDSETDVVGLYLESLPRGRLFMEQAAASAKPLVALKSGASQAGARAALSHTASLAGDARLTQGLLADAGVWQARDFHHLLDLARALSLARSLPKSARLAIVTPSGGAGILSCDLMERHGLAVAELSPQCLTRLREIFPPWMPPANPVDIYPAVQRVGRGRAFREAIQALLDDENVDAVLCHYLMGFDDEVLDLAGLKAMADAAGKHLAFWEVGFQDDAWTYEQQAQALDLLMFSELDRAIECLAAAAAYEGPTARPTLAPSPAPPLPAPATNGEPKVLDEFESKRILAEWGLPMVREIMTRDLAQALAAGQELGYPLVLKGVLPGVAHKTERGLVKGQVWDRAGLETAWAELRTAMAGQGQVLVQPRLAAEYELMAGYLRDERFGPCLMLGMGGLLAELKPDVAFTLAPARPEKIMAMLTRLDSRRLFQGYRNLPFLDTGALCEIMLRLGQEAAARPEIEQVDINPLLVCGGRPMAVDASIIRRG